VRPEGLGKFKNPPNWESNPRPSGLQHSALTTTLPRTPVYIVVTGIVVVVMVFVMTFVLVFAVLVMMKMYLKLSRR
jgi:hypothetical protein